MKVTTTKETTRQRLEIRGVMYDGMDALALDLVVLGPSSEVTDGVTEGRQWILERISSEVSWEAGPPGSRRIDTVKGGSWFARLVQDCLRSTDLELPNVRLPITITDEIKEAMKGRVIRARLSADPRSGRPRIEKKSVQLIPLAQPVPQPERDVTPVLLEIL